MYNISYFAETLPAAFRNWTLAQQWDYFNTNLEGFGSLDNDTQWLIAKYVTPDEVDKAYDKYVNEKGGAGSWSNFLLVLKQYIDGLFTTTMTMTTEAPSDPCSGMLEVKNFFILMMCPFAVACLVGLSFLQKRKYMNRGCCAARPGLMYAVDLVHAHKRLWATGAVFGLLSYGILNLFFGELILDFSAYQDHDFADRFGWTKVFLIILNVAILCTVYYPLLACVSQRRHLAANIVGLVYLTPWVAWSIILSVACPPTRDMTSDKTSQLTGTSYLIFDIPVYVCYILLYIAYIVDLVKNSRKLCGKLTKTDMKMHSSYQYVKELFVPPRIKRPTNLIGRLIEKLKYTKTPGFRYSPRVICSVVCSAFALYKTSTEADIYFDMIVDMLRPIVKEFGTFFLMSNNTKLYDQIAEGLDLVQIEFKVSNYIAAIAHLLFMVDIIRMYRQNMLKMFRGDRSWIHVKPSSPPSTMVHGIRYGGYQIAYMIYGWIIMMVLVFLILVFFTYLIALPIRDGYSTPVLHVLAKAWPTVILGIFIWVAQILLCKFLFLQERGKYLAINNRRLFCIFDFFLFFYNVVLGVFSCLKRVLLSMVLGTLLISRLDRCLLMSGFEQLDSGSQAYLGMIALEEQNTHPVMVVFIRLLEEAREEQIGKERTAEMKKSRKYRNKWYRAFTLVRNPSIVLERLQKELQQRSVSDGKLLSEGNAMIEAATVVAGFGGSVPKTWNNQVTAL